MNKIILKFKDRDELLAKTEAVYAIALPNNHLPKCSIIPSKNEYTISIITTDGEFTQEQIDAYNKI